LKLAARRDERNPGKLWRQETGNRVIGELRSLQRGRLRHDGYASDSAVLDDDDDTWAGSPISGQVRAIRIYEMKVARSVFGIINPRMQASCEEIKTYTYFIERHCY